MKKNIIIIVTDQLTWRALPAYGDTFVKTPNIDRIAKEGVKFEQCYTPCPICQPARAAFWSGLYSHEVDVRSNGRNWPVTPVGEDIPAIGEVFTNAGYDAVHFGKCHDAGTLRGFKCHEETLLKIPDEHEAFPLNMDTYIDHATRLFAVDYLNERKENAEKPYLLVADLVNPHNICGWVGENAYDKEELPLPAGFELPPLPENFEFDDIENRPKGVQYICCSHNRQAQTVGWTEKKFRHYLAAYYYYLTLVDKEIGKILDALEESGEKDNTMVMLIADHGDSMAARGMATKQVNFYEEIARVPFMFSGAGITQQSRGIEGVVTLLDMFPTLCSFAGIEAPAGMRGLDISAALTGGNLPQRDYVASQWHTEWGYTVSPGRMICTGDYKYTFYIEDNAEELFDLVADPYEKKNLVNDSAYAEKLEEMRAHFKHYIEETGDDIMSIGWKADEKWRSHPVGYQNHTGIAAPMEN